VGEGRAALPRRLPRHADDKAANDTAAEFLKAKIREIVKDPHREAAADIDHPYAAKRPPIDTDYFETFNRDNVTLVDVRTDPIEASRRPASALRSGASTRSTSSSSRPASTP
jgi:cation diffusion facilitator CzcD-associated flavoprotein CzcO